MKIIWPTHKYRIRLKGMPLHEGDNLLVALDLFGQICGEAALGATLGPLWFNADHHHVTGEPLVEARCASGQVLAVLYGVTLEQWLEHGVQDGQRTDRPVSVAG